MARRGDDVPGESPGVGHHRSNDRDGRVFLPPFAMEKMMTENAPLREVIKNPIDLWRKTLTEEDREMLKKMLPETTRNDENLVENVVKDLFTGKTFQLDNPAERVWNQIRRRLKGSALCASETDQEGVAETEFVFEFAEETRRSGG